MERTKGFYIRSWKGCLDRYPAKVLLMDEAAWYGSLVGLGFRLFLAGLITREELERELI